MIISHSPAAHSYVSGKLDTLLETDQTSYYSRSYIEEQIELNWQNNENDMNAGFQFDLRHEGVEQQSQINKETDAQINQLFFTHKTADINYTLGRFNRSDPLGFYTLDGIAVKYDLQNWGTGFHAGKPLQIEDYNIIDADRIYGIDINHHTSHINNFIIQKINSYIGWQQIHTHRAYSSSAMPGVITEQDITQNYIHWAISGNGGHNDIKSNEIDLFFNGSYLTENRTVESINAGTQVHHKDLGLTRIAYNTWKPEQADLSFKEQFYSVYANGRQSTLQADFFYDHSWNQQYYIRGRKVWREFGNNGYGTAAGFEHRTASINNLGWQTQWDYLTLRDDEINSLYLGINKNISATLRTHLNTALQYTKSKRTEDNKLFAVEAVSEQMINSNLFIDFNARYIYNDRLKDEYRFTFRLSYRFDDRIWSRR